MSEYLKFHLAHELVKMIPALVIVLIVLACFTPAALRFLYRKITKA